MSAIKERKLVWEENGRLKFAKNPPNPILIAAAKDSPIPFDEYEKYLAKQPSREERKRIPHFKGTMTKGADWDTKLPRVVYTPKEWERCGVEAKGNKFEIVTQIARMNISPRELEIAQLDPALKLTGLTLSQALQIGAIIDAALVRLLDSKK